jgi:DNA-binding NarL/FixJ family response regulator
VSLPDPTVRVAIVDDHDAIHAGVEAWCREAELKIDLVGRYPAVEAFLLEHPTVGDTVDVVLLDLELQSREPDFGAVEHLSGIGHRVIVYSHIVHEEVILRCLDLGADTYIAKAEGKEHLIEAVRAVAAGTAYIGPRMAGAISNDARAAAQSDRA